MLAPAPPVRPQTATSGPPSSVEGQAVVAAAGARRRGRCGAGRGGRLGLRLPPAHPPSLCRRGRAWRGRRGAGRRRARRGRARISCSRVTHTARAVRGWLAARSMVTSRPRTRADRAAASGRASPDGLGGELLGEPADGQAGERRRCWRSIVRQPQLAHRQQKASSTARALRRAAAARRAGTAGGGRGARRQLVTTRPVGLPALVPPR